MLSPLQVARSAHRLVSIGLVTLDGEQIILVDGGLKWIHRNRLKIFGDTRNLYWKNIPKRYLRKSNDLGFSPNRRNIEASLFSQCR
jgi:hypothetical protein